MQVKGGRLELLVPHMLRGQLLRPGFVRLSLKLGAARSMPAWAKLQFLNHGVTESDLDDVLGRVSSLESWSDEWEATGRAYEKRGRDAIEFGKAREASRHFLTASAAYNFAQYVVFMDPDRKRQLHEGCVRAYANAAPHFDVPAVPFEVPFRRYLLRGYLRVPTGDGPRPVVVIFNGTNAVKEELHWWADAFVQRGCAVCTFDGPGLGETFHRLGHQRLVDHLRRRAVEIDDVALARNADRRRPHRQEESGRVDGKNHEFDRRAQENDRKAVDEDGKHADRDGEVQHGEFGDQLRPEFRKLRHVVAAVAGRIRNGNQEYREVA
jgi:hypothetical protein